FDVSDRDAPLDRRDGRGHGRVHIAHDQHQIETQRLTDRIQALHDLGGLERVRPRADLQIDVRWANLENPGRIARTSPGRSGLLVMARMSGAILTKSGLAPPTLTIRIDRRAPPSDREDITDGRELDIAKESRELLLFSCHADVMTNLIPPGHGRPGL